MGESMDAWMHGCMGWRVDKINHGWSFWVYSSDL